MSQAATVNVHTKKYLCAERCGGRSRDGGRAAEGSAITGPVAVAGVWEERNRNRERPGTRPACYELIQSDQAQTPKPAFFGHCHLDQPFRLFPSSSTPPSRSPHSRSARAGLTILLQPRLLVSVGHHSRRLAVVAAPRSRLLSSYYIASSQYTPVPKLQCLL